MKRKILLSSICLLFLLSACSDKTIEENKIIPEENTSLDTTKTDTENEEDKNLEQEQDPIPEEEEEVVIEVDPLPQSLAELAELTPGYTGPKLFSIEEADQDKLDELMKDLPDISGNPSKSQLDNFYNEILAVFQHNFIGPEKLIAKLRFQAIGNPDIEDPRMQFKENLNVLVVLDASGSMGKDLGGETQMNAAKKAITNFVEGLPQEANVGLRIYGHEGTGKDSDKALSCSSSESIYPLGKYDRTAFQSALEKAQPAGWTPIQLALNEAQKDLAQYKGDQNTNIVYLVSDGVSTCDDDPVTAAKNLYDSDITPIVNVIGFNVDDAGQKQLKEVAKATEGTYEDVQNAQSLQNELDQAKNLAKSWQDWKDQKESSLKHDKVSNSLDIFGYEATEFSKLVNEKGQIATALQHLFQNKKSMSRESHDYLRKKNTEYHNWIEEEYKSLKKDLRELNETKIGEALQSLEDKYLKNSPEQED